MRKFIYILLVCLSIYKVESQWIYTNGPNSSSINALAKLESNLYAGTDGGGVLFSSDYGESWSPINDGLLNHIIYTLVIAEGNFFAGTGDGIFVSTDYGLNWASLNHGLPQSLYVNCILVDGLNLFIGTGNGIYYSNDYGNNWEPANEGLNCTIVQSLSKHEELIFAGTWGCGVFSSSDNGANWQPANDGIEECIITSFFISDSRIIAGSLMGIFYSDDNGSNWTYAEDIEGIKCFSSINNLILAGSLYGVLSSTDEGINWNPMPLGFDFVPGIYTLAQIDSIIFGAGAGFIRSIDGGNNWEKINSGLSPGLIMALSTSPTGDIFACSDNGFSFKSINGSSSWMDADSGMTFAGTRNIRFHPNGTFYSGTSHNIFRSFDNGFSWSQSDSGFQDSMTWVNDISFNSEGHIFAATSDSIYKSTDNGDSWFRTNSGLNTCGIQSILVDNNDRVFAGTMLDGIYISTNSGNTWSQINNGLSTDRIMILGNNSNDDIFAGSYWDGFFRTIDHGLNWQNVLYYPPFCQGFSLAIRNNGDLFFGIAGGYDYNCGVWFSSDNGDNWIQVNEGFDANHSVTSLTLDASYLFAGTEMGVWKRLLSDFNAINIYEDNYDNLIKIYPNPANNYLYIENHSSFSINFIIIYGPNGNIILKDSFIEPLLTINLTNWQCGVYFIQIVSSNFNTVKKVIKS